MAIDGAGYSSSEFQLAFKAESTIGTANVSTMQLIDIDEISFPNQAKINFVKNTMFLNN